MANEAYQSHRDAQEQPGDEDRDKITATKLRNWFTDAYKGQSDFRTEVVDNLKMLSGDQWPEDLKARLREQGMAPIVINRMLMPIMYISGVQRQTRQEPKLIAFEAGDARSTELMNALLHWVQEQNNCDERNSRVFLDKVAVGLGWWKVSMDFEGTDIEGQIRVRRRQPLTIFPDPNWLDNEWEAAQYVMDAQWFTCGEAADKWPEFAEDFKRQPGEWTRTSAGDMQGAGLGEEIGDSLSSQRLFWDEKTKRVRVVEAWYKQRDDITVAYNVQTGETESNPDKVARLQQLVPQLPPDQQEQILLIPRSVTTVRVAHFFEDRLLDDEPSPFETTAPTFPIFPSMGYYFWKQPFGLADLMKDLQREKNKRRSKLIELIGRMPLSGFFNKNTGGADPKQIEEYGAGNGIVIGYDTEQPQPIRPPDMPMALVRLEDKADEEIKDVPNVHNELLGQATQKTISGRAIEARQRGGLISHEYLFDTFRQEQAEVVKFMVALIQQYMSPTKALRILGSIANRQPDSPAGQLMAQAQDPAQLGAQDVMAALSDALNIEYDVVISARPAEPSMAMQSWETLSEMAGQGAPIPPKVLFEAAAKAGIMDEGQVSEILAFMQQQQAAAAPQGPPPGAAPPGPPPGAPPQAGPPPA